MQKAGTKMTESQDGFYESPVERASKEGASHINRAKAEDDTKTIWGTCPVIKRAPGQCSGRWVFKDIRLPVWMLFEHLTEGGTIDSFCEKHNTENHRDTVQQLLQHMYDHLEADRRYDYAYTSRDMMTQVNEHPHGSQVDKASLEVATLINKEKEKEDAKTVWGGCSIIERVLGKCSGRWVFTDSRLPICHLFGLLAYGHNIDGFYDSYGMESDKTRQLLGHLANRLREDIRYDYAHTN